MMHSWSVCVFEGNRQGEISRLEATCAKRWTGCKLWLFYGWEAVRLQRSRDCIFSLVGKASFHLQSHPTNCCLLCLHYHWSVSSDGNGLPHASFLPSRQFLGPNSRLDQGNWTSIYNCSFVFTNMRNTFFCQICHKCWMVHIGQTGFLLSSI